MNHDQEDKQEGGGNGGETETPAETPEEQSKTEEVVAEKKGLEEEGKGVGKGLPQEGQIEDVEVQRKRRKKKEVKAEEDGKKEGVKKRRKKTDPETTQGTEQPPGEADLPEEERKKTEKTEVKSEMKNGDEEKVEPPKRKRGGEASTFARRVEPKTEFSKLKWQVLKEVFIKNIKPELTHYSAHEDLERVGLWRRTTSKQIVIKHRIYITGVNFWMYIPGPHCLVSSLGFFLLLKALIPHPGYVQSFTLFLGEPDPAKLLVLFDW